MGKKLRLTPALLLLAALGVFAWAVLAPQEPVYQGRTLTSWLDDYASYNKNPDELLPTDDAVRHIGTNAIPVLLEMLAATDSPIKQKLIEWNAQLPVIRLPLKSAYQRHTTAFRALDVLQAEARPAVPVLTGYLTNYDWWESCESALLLADIGPENIGLLTNALISTNARIRSFAMTGLEQYASHFLGLVNHKEGSKETKFTKPEDFESTARMIVPALLACLKDPDYYLRSRAAEALGRFAREPTFVVPVLTETLNDPHARGVAAWALGQYGPQARSAVPALLPLLQEKDYFIAHNATNALKQIDPEAAARAGVK